MIKTPNKFKRNKKTISPTTSEEKKIDSYSSTKKDFQMPKDTKPKSQLNNNHFKLMNKNSQVEVPKM